MHFNEFWMTNHLKYEHILYENSDFMSQDWEKNKSKVCLVKSSFINISRSTVSDCALFLVVPFFLYWTKLKFLYTGMDYFSRKSLSKYLMSTIEFNKHDFDIFINGTWEKIRGQHRVTLQNYKATWTSLLTNEKSKSTFTRQLLRPLTWALLLVLF